jgi:hypothetical protein
MENGTMNTYLEGKRYPDVDVLELVRIPVAHRTFHLKMTRFGELLVGWSTFTFAM